MIQIIKLFVLKYQNFIRSFENKEDRVNVTPKRENVKGYRWIRSCCTYGIHINLSISANKFVRCDERERERERGREKKEKNIADQGMKPREQDRDMITNAKSIVHQPFRFSLRTPAWRHARKQLVALLLPDLQSNHFCIL